MNMLQLYLPHRTENMKPNKFETFESFYQKGYKDVNGERVPVKDIVMENM